MRKRILAYVSIIAFVALFSGLSNSATTWYRSLSIGDPAASPSAIFEVQSGVLGSIFAPPMSQAQRDAISSPDNALTIYNTDTQEYNIYNGTVWGAVSGDAADRDLNNLLATSINQSLLPETNVTKNLGSTSLRWNELWAEEILLGDGSTLAGKLTIQDSSGSTSFTMTGIGSSSPNGNTLAKDIHSSIAGENMGLFTVSATSGSSGDIYIETGVGVAAANSGSITIEPGTAGGTRGQFNIVDGSEGTSGHVWTSTGTAGQGAWAAAAGGGDLWSDPLDSNIVPDGAGTRSLGQSSSQLANIYTNNLFLGSNTANPFLVFQSSGSARAQVEVNKPYPSGSTAGLSIATATGHRLGLLSDLDMLLETVNGGGAGSGGVKVRTGVPSAGTRGSIGFLDGSEGTAGECWVSSDTSGNGNWDVCPGGSDWADPVDANIVPDLTTNNRNIGSSSSYFNDVFSKSINLFNGTDPLSRITLTGFGSTMPSGEIAGVQLVSALDRDLGIYSDNDNVANVTRTGDLFLETGNKTAGTGDSGSIKIEPGTSLGGARGKIHLQEGSEGQPGECWVSSGPNGEGFWQECPSAKNYISLDDSLIEQDSSGWVTYFESGGYIDGAGPAASFLQSQSTTVVADVLEGTRSLNIVKSANATLDEGISVETLTIDQAYRGRTIYSSFEIDFTDVDYAGEFVIHVYDITNSAPLFVKSSTSDNTIPNSRGRFDYNFQTLDTTAQVRVTLHIATTTSANAWGLYLDVAKASPDVTSPGASPLDKNFDAVRVTALGALTSQLGNIVSSTSKSATGTYLINFTGLTVAPSVTATIDDSVADNAQKIAVTAVSNTQATIQVYIAATTLDRAISVHIAKQGADYSNGAALSTTDTLFKSAKLRAYRSTTQTITTSVFTDILFDVVQQQDGAIDFNTGTGVFTVKKAGWYNVKAQTVLGAINTASTLELRITGTALLAKQRETGSATNNDRYLDVSTFAHFDVDDIIKIEVFHNTGVNKNIIQGSNNTWLSIEEVPDFSVFSVHGETEIIEAGSSVFAAWGGGSVWGNATNIPIPIGEWVLTGTIVTNNAAALASTQNMQVAISEFTTTTTTDHENAKNVVSLRNTAVSGDQYTLTVPAWNLSTTSGTTVYLKLITPGGNANIQYTYYLLARRIK